MAKQIKQLRYFGPNDYRNYPTTISREQLKSKSYMETYSPILQISVHTLPGVIMYFNNDSLPVYVGHSGVYQLDMTDTTPVLYNVRFTDRDLDLIEKSNFGLIIDLMYEDGYTDNTVEEEETIITSSGGKASVQVLSNIKNIWKNIWFGISDPEEKLRPFILQENAGLMILREEYLRRLQALRDNYEAMIDNLDPDDPMYTDIYAKMTCCYKKALIALKQALEEEIAAYKEMMQGGGIDDIDKAIRDLQDRMSKIEQDFMNLELDSIYTYDDNQAELILNKGGI